ncbi:MAG: CPBP family glutamic-type intramembrane protease [Bryobacteraceae bacterium]
MRPATTVPIPEELAFRGFLLRRLMAEDFESIPLGRVTWPALLVPSVAFGALARQSLDRRNADRASLWAHGGAQRLTR